MKTTNRARRSLIMAALAGMAAQAQSGTVAAQDAVKVMPRAYRVALENEQVRVLEFTGRPGMGVCGDGMHSHPAHLTVVLSDFKTLSTAPDGATRRFERKQGDVFWSEAETHQVENTAAGSSRVLIIELKTPSRPSV